MWGGLMVCLATRRILLGGRPHGITSITVWWTVPGLGLFPNLEDALEQGTTVIPTPVAVATDGIYEVIPPEMEVKS